jgi:hypothetical protein
MMMARKVPEILSDQQRHTLVLGKLERLENSLPGMIASHLHESEFWIDFSCSAEGIQAEAGVEDVELVRRRLDDMLRARGMVTDEKVGH